MIIEYLSKHGVVVPKNRDGNYPPLKILCNSIYLLLSSYLATIRAYFRLTHKNIIFSYSQGGVGALSLSEYDKN